MPEQRVQPAFSLSPHNSSTCLLGEAYETQTGCRHDRTSGERLRSSCPRATDAERFSHRVRNRGNTPRPAIPSGSREGRGFLSQTICSERPHAIVQFLPYRKSRTSRQARHHGQTDRAACPARQPGTVHEPAQGSQMVSPQLQRGCWP